jgi:hypothetical protein
MVCYKSRKISWSQTLTGFTNTVTMTYISSILIQVLNGNTEIAITGGYTKFMIIATRKCVMYIVFMHIMTL